MKNHFTRKMFFVLLALLVSFSAMQVDAKSKKKKTKPAQNELKASVFSGLKWRSIGPAFTSGRIADIAVDPGNHSRFYVAAASGGIWKTTDDGTTFKPVFDHQIGRAHV